MTKMKGDKEYQDSRGKYKCRQVVIFDLTEKENVGRWSSLTSLRRKRMSKELKEVTENAVMMYQKAEGTYQCKGPGVEAFPLCWGRTIDSSG